jgi:DedD protein
MVAGLTHAIYSRGMDRALKERIVGAVVLVVIAVLVVPVFLDGPAPDAEMISESVMLPGQDGGDDRRTVVLQLDRDQPLPASGSPPEARPVSTSSSADPGDSPAPAPAENRDAPPTTVAAAPQEQKREPVSEPAPDPEPEPPAREQEPPPPATGAGEADTESATGMWAVQIGSFSNKENADRLAAGLREKGYAAFLSQVRTGGGELHRVRIGPQKDRDSAEAVALRLAADDVDGQVVPHP